MATATAMALDDHPVRGRTGLWIRAIAILAVCALAVGLVIGRRRHPSPPVSLTRVGVYVGAGNVAGFDAFARQLGARPGYVMDYLDGNSWAGIEDPDWLLSRWSEAHVKLVLSVPMLPYPGGGSLAQEAQGDDDARFTTLARRLVAGGAGDITLRLGWEFNGNWFPWSIQHGQAQRYAEAWRRIVTAMRTVPGAHFRFDWCVNGGSSVVDGVRLDPEAAYPGDAYVDIIGLDQYDASPTSGEDAQHRFALYVNQPYGLAWQRRFARAHGKPVSFPEWGLLSGGDPADQVGGGDSPTFVNDMYAWFDTSDLAYQSYFDFDTSVGRSSLQAFPQAASRYRQLTRGGRPATSSATTPLRQ